MNKKVFHTGQQLKARFIGDANAIVQGRVLSRTDKTVTVEVENEPAKRFKIFFDMDKNEMIYPLGRYSKAPTFRANEGELPVVPSRKKVELTKKEMIEKTKEAYALIQTGLEDHLDLARMLKNENWNYDICKEEMVEHYKRAIQRLKAVENFLEAYDEAYKVKTVN